MTLSEVEWVKAPSESRGKVEGLTLAATLFFSCSSRNFRSTVVPKVCRK